MDQMVRLNSPTEHVISEISALQVQGINISIHEGTIAGIKDKTHTLIMWNGSSYYCKTPVIHTCTLQLNMLISNEKKKSNTLNLIFLTAHKLFE